MKTTRIMRIFLLKAKTFVPLHKTTPNINKDKTTKVSPKSASVPKYALSHRCRWPYLRWRPSEIITKEHKEITQTYQPVIHSASFRSDGVTINGAKTAFKLARGRFSALTKISNGNLWQFCFFFFNSKVLPEIPRDGIFRCT